MEVSGELHAPAALPPGKYFRTTHRIGGWVGPRAGLDGFGEKKSLFSIPEFEPRTVQPVASRYSIVIK